MKGDVEAAAPQNTANSHSETLCIKVLIAQWCERPDYLEGQREKWWQWSL